MKQHWISHKSIQVSEIGLVIDSTNHFLGATPDGKVECEVCGRFLIEIKCPWTHRFDDPGVAALSNKCFKDEKDIWHLDPKSKFYAQIQGQLYICKEKLCKLIIYTTRNILVIDVAIDKVYCEEMRDSLREFDMNFLGPATLKNFEKEL